MYLNPAFDIMKCPSRDPTTTADSALSASSATKKPSNKRKHNSCDDYSESDSDDQGSIHFDGQTGPCTRASTASRQIPSTPGPPSEDQDCSITTTSTAIAATVAKAEVELLGLELPLNVVKANLAGFGQNFNDSESGRLSPLRVVIYVPGKDGPVPVKGTKGETVLPSPDNSSATPLKLIIEGAFADFNTLLALVETTIADLITTRNRLSTRMSAAMSKDVVAGARSRATRAGATLRDSSVSAEGEGTRVRVILCEP